MKFVEPLGVYFGDIAKDATLNGTAVKVIFDDGYQLGLSEFEGRNPQVNMKEADIPAGTQHGASLVITGVGSFTVREIQPDGNGMAVLQLRKV